MSLLTVTNLRATVGGQQVVEDISFEVPATGVTAVLGRNGVGKSSTLKGILGLYDRTGEVTFDGERIDAEPTHRIVQRGIAYVPEDREVFTMLTVQENLALATRQDQPRWDFVHDLFPELKKRAAQRAGTLSGGQQQMVSLGRALINDNRLLLVDETARGDLHAGVEKGLEQVGYRRPTGLGMQVADEGRGARGPTALLTGELSTACAQRLPEQGRPLRAVACLAEPVQPGIGQCQSWRAEQPGQRQIVSRVGQRGQGVEQITNLRPAVEAAARYGEEGDAGAFQGIFVGRE